MQNLIATLTVREKDVFDLLMTSATSREIAGDLSITETTVKYHLTNIYNKLGVSNRMGALSYGLQDREIEAPALTSGGAFTEKQIRAAATVLVEKKLGSKSSVNELVINLLAALEGKL